VFTNKKTRQVSISLRSEGVIPLLSAAAIVMKNYVGNILYTDIIIHCSTSRKFLLYIGDGADSYFAFTIHFS
jgi:TRAP-type uncharacterized transport system fused permease subunit